MKCRQDNSETNMFFHVLPSTFLTTGYSTDLTQEPYSESRRIYGSHTSTWAWSYKSKTSILPNKIHIMSCGEIGDLSQVWNTSISQKLVKPGLASPSEVDAFEATVGIVMFDIWPGAVWWSCALMRLTASSHIAATRGATGLRELDRPLTVEQTVTVVVDTSTHRQILLRSHGKGCNSPELYQRIPQVHFTPRIT